MACRARRTRDGSDCTGVVIERVLEDLILGGIT
jgi:hypothetical protein